MLNSFIFFSDLVLEFFIFSDEELQVTLNVVYFALEVAILFHFLFPCDGCKEFFLAMLTLLFFRLELSRLLSFVHFILVQRVVFKLELFEFIG